MMTKISELHTYGKRYIIAKDEHGYWAIGEKYTDGGKFTKRINGLQGHLSDTIDGCIASATMEACIESLVDSGMDRMAAFHKAWEIIGW